MKIEMIRYESTSDGVFGILKVNGEKFHTVEKPWNNNEPFESCIPAGNYKLVPHDSAKYGVVLCMINPELNITRYQEVESKRYACLIHPANYAKDVEGCIGLGKARYENMVTHSRKTTAHFYSLVDPTESHDLSIEWREK